MPPSQARLAAAAHAHAGRQRQRLLNAYPPPAEVTHNITHVSSSESESQSKTPGLDEEGTHSESDAIEELTGPELLQSLEHEIEREDREIQELNVFNKITCFGNNWKNAECHIQGNYTGNSEHTRRWEKQCLEAKATGDEKMLQRHAQQYIVQETLLTWALQCIR
ncbi:hypothetical protein EI94DRAFT_1707483 [Lactarius quietus]|nr:hypothetical protein EI94DRAFT_1707483 [Lactarius quietus]